MDSQSTIETLRTSKSFSGTVNNIPFLQPPFHSAGIDVVNMTFLHSSHVQTAENDMSAANQPATSNISMLQGNSPISSAESTLETLALPYDNNQPANPNLWNSIFVLTSLLEIDKFQSYDTKNITCSLMHIGTIIKQCLLSNKLIKDFSDLADVGFVTWRLINAIYESSWDRLSVDNNKKLI